MYILFLFLVLMLKTHFSLYDYSLQHLLPLETLPGTSFFILYYGKKQREGLNVLITSVCSNLCEINKITLC